MNDFLSALVVLLWTALIVFFLFKNGTKMQQLAKNTNSPLSYLQSKIAIGMFIIGGIMLCCFIPMAIWVLFYN